MSDKTVLAVPGKKLSVPRLFKRTLQVSTAVLLTLAVALTFIVANSMLLGRGSLSQAFSAWLTFVQRSDIQATIVLTAIVTVAFVYWQRDRERR
ncbi:MAG: hypothetical protein DIU63_07295 [Proteobacteria bacterium]|jgi:hypothetical protein|nr:MAG: hypothetical protein DIU63_07295 [Pseudomonadota bacterium]